MNKIKKNLFIFIFLFFYMSNFSYSESMKDIGLKGNLNDVTRIQKITMFDNYFEPASLNVKEGETILFKIVNSGNLVHEFNIGTKEMHSRHQSEMQTLVDNEILLPDKIDFNRMKILNETNKNLHHSHSNSVLLAPKQKSELIWKFLKNSNIEFACNVPGHYEVGMFGEIAFNH